MFPSSCPTCLVTCVPPSSHSWSARMLPRLSPFLGSRFVRLNNMQGEKKVIVTLPYVVREWFVYCALFLLTGNLWHWCDLHHDSGGLGRLCRPRLHQLLLQLAPGAFPWTRGHGLHVRNTHTPLSYASNIYNISLSFCIFSVSLSIQCQDQVQLAGIWP